VAPEGPWEEPREGEDFGQVCGGGRTRHSPSLAVPGAPKSGTAPYPAASVVPGSYITPLMPHPLPQKCLEARGGICSAFVLVSGTRMSECWPQSHEMDAVVRSVLQVRKLRLTDPVTIPSQLLGAESSPTHF
jgi:hypothetical protein